MERSTSSILLSCENNLLVPSKQVKLIFSEWLEGVPQIGIIPLWESMDLALWETMPSAYNLAMGTQLESFLGTIFGK
jgi:hypothetical protein